jgi:hypothetical protein
MTRESRVVILQANLFAGRDNKVIFHPKRKPLARRIDIAVAWRAIASSSGDGTNRSRYFHRGGIFQHASSIAYHVQKRFTVGFHADQHYLEAGNGCTDELQIR